MLKDLSSDLQTNIIQCHVRTRKPSTGGHGQEHSWSAAARRPSLITELHVSETPSQERGWTVPENNT